MRTLAQFIRHGGQSDSDMISLGWFLAVAPLGIVAATILAVIAVAPFAWLALTLFGPGPGATLSMFVMLAIAMSVVGTAMMIVGSRRSSG